MQTTTPLNCLRQPIDLILKVSTYLVAHPIICTHPTLSLVPSSTPSPQLEAVNWLRRMWAAGKSAILADDTGLGKAATVLAFAHCLL
jgi:SNF2 family DNA or RNA helicase